MYGDDWLDGGNGDDRLLGDQGHDTLIGGGGADFLRGFSGSDHLTGGSGADIFEFGFVEASTTRATTDPDNPLGIDFIFDFEQGIDRIDLSMIDPDGTAGPVDSFTFIGTTAFSGTVGELRYRFDGSKTVIEGDVDGDGTADLVIHLVSTGDVDVMLLASDFVL